MRPWLPVREAEHRAFRNVDGVAVAIADGVRRFYLNDEWLIRGQSPFAPQVIADDGLQVRIAQAAPGRKRT